MISIQVSHIPIEKTTIYNKDLPMVTYFQSSQLEAATVLMRAAKAETTIFLCKFFFNLKNHYNVSNVLLFCKEQHGMVAILNYDLIMKLWILLY